MDTPQLNLAHEILHLTCAVEGARLLIDQLACDALVDEHDRLALPAATRAVLVLIDCRLRLLRQVVADELPPRVLCAPHNFADGAPGVLLGWDAADELRHAETEHDRALQMARHATEER